MKVTFNSEKYAIGVNSVSFEGVVKNGDTVSFVPIFFSSGENELDDIQYKALQERSDYEQLVKDGVFSLAAIPVASTEKPETPAQKIVVNKTGQ